MDNQKEKGGEITRLKFTRQADNSKENPEEGKVSFEVMINPESISQVLSISSTQEGIGYSRHKGDQFDCNPEAISFTFYLDGTHVVPSQKGRAVDEMIKDFLRVVYKNSDGKPVRSVSILYGSNDWNVRTTSITIEHILFDKGGHTLRAKVACSFSSIKSEKRPKKTPPKKKITSMEKTPTVGTNCRVVCDENRQKEAPSLRGNYSPASNFRQ